MDRSHALYETAFDAGFGSLGRGKGNWSRDVEGTRMVETTTGGPQILRDAPAAWSVRRYLAAPVVLARWTLVLLATVLWLVAVPLAALAGELRRGLTS
jgi:hypothetical protein